MTSNSYLNTGGRYNPSTDTWIATSTINAPDGRTGHTAVWTGSEMIVWGGDHGRSNRHWREILRTSSSNAYTHTDTYPHTDADGHRNSRPGCHNQARHERRKFLCYTQWVTQSTWVHHDAFISSTA